MHAHTCSLASRRVCITGEAAPARTRTSRPRPPHRRRTSRLGWAATPTCTPWACRRRAALQRGLPCCTPSPRCTPCHAAPPSPRCTLHARTAPPLARLPAPCQASYKLSKELHDTHKSCTEHWVSMATQACAGGGLHQVGHISMGQIHLLVLCKPHLADSISEVETGSVSLGDHVQPDRHCNLQPHAPQPAPRLVTACTLARCRRAWAAWAPTRAGSPSPSACARPTCASSTRTSPRTRARSTC